MVDAAHLGSAKRDHRRRAAVPVRAAGQEVEAARADHARASSRRCCNAAGVDRVLTMDLHAGQVQGFFDGPVDHMTALPMFAQYFRDQGISGDEVCVVSADAGRTKLAKKFAEMLDASLAIISKDRPDAQRRRGDRRDRRREGARPRRDHLRRHDRHRRHPLRGRRGRQAGRRGAGHRLRDAPDLLAAGAGADQPTARSTRSSSPTPCRSIRSRGRRR